MAITQKWFDAGAVATFLQRLKEGQDEGRRARSSVITSDYQIERFARDIAGRIRSHIHLAGCPDLQEILPWARPGRPEGSR